MEKTSSREAILGVGWHRHGGMGEHATPAILGQKPIDKSCCIDRSQNKKLAESKARLPRSAPTIPNVGSIPSFASQLQPSPLIL